MMIKITLQRDKNTLNHDRYRRRKRRLSASFPPSTGERAPGQQRAAAVTRSGPRVALPDQSSLSRIKGFARQLQCRNNAAGFELM
jgi:hypothetical protein